MDLCYSVCALNNNNDKNININKNKLKCLVLAYYMTGRPLSALGLLPFLILLTVQNSYYCYHDAQFTSEEAEVKYAQGYMVSIWQ